MNDYIYEVARIRVKETGLLTGADYEQLLSEPTVSSALAFLADKGWADGEAKLPPDEFLRREDASVWELMGELVKDSGDLDILRLTKDFHNLKAAVKQLYTGSSLSPERLYEDGGVIPVAEILGAVKDQEFDRLPEGMAAAAKEATEVLARTGDGQLCDTIIDKAALAALIRAGEATDDPVLKDYAELTAASACVRTALRAAAGGRDTETIRSMLNETPGLDLHALTEAAVNGKSAVAEYLSATPYEPLAASLQKGMSAFECACDDLMTRRMRNQRSEISGLGPLAAYVIARGNEIKCVRMLLTGKQNHLPEDLLRENLRESYV